MLKYLDTFQFLLRDYTPDSRALELLRQIRLILLVAPAAAGRNSIIEDLMKTDRYHFVVSDTTRSKRMNNGELEINGKQYWFKSEEEVLKALEKGLYVEAAVVHDQQVSGISLSALEDALHTGRIAITDLDIQGSDFISQFQELEHIFILPPDFDEWMRRLDARGAMDVAERRRRLKSAYQEIEDALERPYFHFYINWNLHETSTRLHHEIINGYADASDKQENELHARVLLRRLREAIN